MNPTIARTAAAFQPFRAQTYNRLHVILDAVEPAELTICPDEPAYVAHFWSAYLAGRPHERWGDVLAFVVTREDVAAFPELAGAEVIAIRETDGCVHLTSPEDAALESLE